MIVQHAGTVMEYTTENSTYICDLPQRRYMRLAGAVEHGADLSERLAYGTWLPLADRDDAVTIVPDPYGSPFQAPEVRPVVLHILHERSVVGIYTSAVIDMKLVDFT